MFLFPFSHRESRKVLSPRRARQERERERKKSFGETHAVYVDGSRFKKKVIGKKERSARSRIVPMTKLSLSLREKEVNDAPGSDDAGSRNTNGLLRSSEHVICVCVCVGVVCANILTKNATN